MSKFEVKLIISERMTKRGGEENELIRLPRRAREYFDFKKHRIALGNGPDRIELRIKESYKEDVAPISIDDRSLTGFITQTNYNRLTSSKKSEEFWVTEEGEPIMLGCDPEFALTDRAGIIQYAASILGGRDEAFGSDGILAEIRPDPSQSVDTLIENIRELFKTAPTAAKKLNWIGGATYASNNDFHPVGGHIHIGGTDITSNLDPYGDKADKYYGSLAMLLDDYLGIMLAKIDRPDANIRRKGTYGGYLNYRTNMGRLEWRTPSGFWLVSPHIASVVLGTTKAVSETFWGRLGESKTPEKELVTSFEDAPKEGILSKFGIRFCARTKDILRDEKKVKEKEIEEVIEKLKNIEFYSDYQKYIDGFSDLVIAGEEDLEEIGLDIKANWL